MRHELLSTLEKVRQRLRLVEQKLVRRQHILDPPTIAYLPDARSLEQVAIDDLTWQPMMYHQYWGAWQTNFLMRMQLTIPADWSRREDVALHLPLGDAGDYFNAHPEALIYVDGHPWTATDVRHTRLPLPESYRDQQPRELLLHGWTGLGTSLHGDDRQRLYLQPISVQLLDEKVREFVVLARTAVDAVQSMSTDRPEYGRLLNALEEAFLELDTHDLLSDHFYASVPQAVDTFRKSVDAAGQPLDVDIAAVGHAHIDTAWLWPLAQTRQKARRTFSTVLNLMQRYPEYRFSQSQPQLYAFLNEDAPDLFAEIKTHVAEGRWEALGGMWVEADCNVTGAESLVRQFLLGRRFFREHFGEGTDSPVLWLPDAFGFPWSLPQVAAQAGMKYFFTIKLRWNEHTEFPYDSFWWQGLDGTRLLAHLSPAPTYGNWLLPATYNAEASADTSLGAWQKLRGKETSESILMAYGHGDGGGGPTPEMIENIQILSDFPGVPRTSFSSVDEFFNQLEERVDRRLPIWNGELYLETHQGTLTSQARIKRANRLAERLLHNVEFLATYAMLIDAGYRYPQDELTAVWQVVCLNHFHDILPGSSINAVYAEAAQQYSDVMRQLDVLQQEALETIARHCGGDKLIVNPIGINRNDIYSLAADNDAIAQHLLRLAELPPYSVTPLTSEEPVGKADDIFMVTTNHLENDRVALTFNEQGDLIRIYDKLFNREVLAEGEIGNQLQLFEDRPLHYDAWNIDLGYDQRVWLAQPATVTVMEAGPLRASLQLDRQIGSSFVKQRVTLHRGSARIDFHTEVEWREKHMLLKVAFPVNVLSPEARYSIQWGHISRPTHRNTRADWAKYEVAAHHWADLSEGNYGVALLNDSKYGYDVHENCMRLTLLKSATYPDPHADEGSHEFTYSLLPHRHYDDGWLNNVVAAGYQVNYPLMLIESSGNKNVMQSLPSLVSVPAYQANVMVETIKKAEDSEAVVVRLYEYLRTRGEVCVQFGFNVKRVWRANVLEERQSVIAVENGNRVWLNVKPFEIITLIVERV